MKIKHLFLALLLTASGSAFSQLFDTSKVKIKYVAGAYEARLDVPLSINPDYACMRMSYWSARWRNMLGGTIGVAKAETKNFTASTALGVFVELHDYSQQQFMSWQLWRGCLGASLYMNYKPLDKLMGKGSRLVAELGWYHESQHATDVIGYVSTYMKGINAYGFENGSIRSFEYTVAGLTYNWQPESKNWRILATARYRYFPTPLLPDAYRQQTQAGSIEAGVHYKVGKKTYLYLQGFYESISNIFVASERHYQGTWNKKPFQYRNVELGVLYYNKDNKQFSIFFSRSKSNGRGLDFTTVYNDYGAGIRFAL